LVPCNTVSGCNIWYIFWG